MIFHFLRPANDGRALQLSDQMCDFAHVPIVCAIEDTCLELAGSETEIFVP
ncbi:hypothetical protein D3C73_1554650 [compost metagenome]